MQSLETGLLEQSEYFFHTPTSLARSLLFHVEICGHFYSDHNYRVNRETFGNFLLLYVMNGALHIQTPETDTLVPQGNAALINCHRWHAYETPVFCEFSYVHFDGSNTQALYDHIISNQGNVFPVDERSTLPHYMRLLLSNSRNSKMVSEISFSQIIYSLLSDIIVAPQNESLSGEKAQIIEGALDYIHTHLSEQLSLNDIASHVGLSTYHFARLFKRATGSSPHEYIILSRIDNAKYLLRTTSDSVSQIAYQAGYTTESSFITSFNGRVGMPPGKFRKLFQTS
ncbi:AraC family transcriptional regulator [Ruminococcus sp. OA3]|uniref:AraC family transcriptional regulator n=1 Tax=Ruminococcus sp. OA3 TaxID=2914164 RepID=UPI001F0650CE|nr:AraC family transcriptional regulator [Ruminococcus sp. OA3]MCH1984054.1 AraC family transcriptional regulator [Ruminococcus sp. OA3]